jgi:drug/metabolite transporter (DMT)-like permease
VTSIQLSAPSVDNGRGKAGNTSNAQIATMLLIMVLLWGLSWPAMKLLLDYVPPLWGATLRFATAAVCLFGFLAARGQLVLPKRADWPIVASVALLQMALFTGLGMIAVQYTGAGRASLLAYTTPLWSVLAAWLLFHQRPRGMQAVALAIGLVGIGIVCAPGEIDWSKHMVLIGHGFLLLAAVGWSIVILHVRRHSWTSSPLQLAPWQMLFAALLLMVLAWQLEEPLSIIRWTPMSIGLLLFYGPIATSICFVISSEVGRRVQPFTMANVTLGVPIVGVIASAIFLGETVSLGTAIGMVLIVSSMCIAGWAVKLKADHNRDTLKRNQAGRSNWPSP